LGCVAWLLYLLVCCYYALFILDIFDGLGVDIVVGFGCAICVMLSKKWASEILCFGVLVGAFSVFGRADTGKPVQNYGLFRKIEVFLKL